MKREQRAAQIWSLLALCASRRQILTYGELSQLIGVPNPYLGQLLEPVQSFCLTSKLPPLTSLVVSERTGIPGAGFIAAADVPSAQAQVFAFNWLSTPAPTPEQFEQAVSALPSNGRPLAELQRQGRATGNSGTSST
ncbi:MAG: hypothetical protein FJ296_10725 [Planctomycetes bacterium]|nr:hypothetical protein [Planctomycetota bacterium]